MAGVRGAFHRSSPKARYRNAEASRALAKSARAPHSRRSPRGDAKELGQICFARRKVRRAALRRRPRLAAASSQDLGKPPRTLPPPQLLPWPSGLAVGRRGRPFFTGPSSVPRTRQVPHRSGRGRVSQPGRQVERQKGRLAGSLDGCGRLRLAHRLAVAGSCCGCLWLARAGRGWGGWLTIWLTGWMPGCLATSEADGPFLRITTSLPSFLPGSRRFR